MASTPRSGPHPPPTAAPNSSRGRLKLSLGELSEQTRPSLDTDSAYITSGDMLRMEQEWRELCAFVFEERERAKATEAAEAAAAAAATSAVESGDLSKSQLGGNLKSASMSRRKSIAPPPPPTGSKPPAKGKPPPGSRKPGSPHDHADGEDDEDDEREVVSLDAPSATPMRSGVEGDHPRAVAAGVRSSVSPPSIDDGARGQRGPVSSATPAAAAPESPPQSRPAPLNLDDVNEGAPLGGNTPRHLPAAAPRRVSLSINVPDDNAANPRRRTGRRDSSPGGPRGASNGVPSVEAFSIETPILMSDLIDKNFLGVTLTRDTFTPVVMGTLQSVSVPTMIPAVGTTIIGSTAERGSQGFKSEVVLFQDLLRLLLPRLAKWDLDRWFVSAIPEEELLLLKGSLGAGPGTKFLASTGNRADAKLAPKSFEGMVGRAGRLSIETLSQFDYVIGNITFTYDMFATTAARSGFADVKEFRAPFFECLRTMFPRVPEALMRCYEAVSPTPSLVANLRRIFIDENPASHEITAETFAMLETEQSKKQAQARAAAGARRGRQGDRATQRTVPEDGGGTMATAIAAHAGVDVGTPIPLHPVDKQTLHVNDYKALCYVNRKYLDIAPQLPLTYALYMAIDAAAAGGAVTGKIAMFAAAKFIFPNIVPKVLKTYLNALDVAECGEVKPPAPGTSAALGGGGGAPAGSPTASSLPASTALADPASVVCVSMSGPMTAFYAQNKLLRHVPCVPYGSIADYKGGGAVVLPLLSPDHALDEASAPDHAVLMPDGTTFTRPTSDGDLPMSQLDPAMLGASPTRDLSSPDPSTARKAGLSGSNLTAKPSNDGPVSMALKTVTRLEYGIYTYDDLGLQPQLEENTMRPRSKKKRQLLPKLGAGFSKLPPLEQPLEEFQRRSITPDDAQRDVRERRTISTKARQQEVEAYLFRLRQLAQRRAEEREADRKHREDVESSSSDDELGGGFNLSFSPQALTRNDGKLPFERLKLSAVDRRESTALRFGGADNDRAGQGALGPGGTRRLAPGAEGRSGGFDTSAGTQGRGKRAPDGAPSARGMLLSERGGFGDRQQSPKSARVLKKASPFDEPKPRKKAPEPESSEPSKPQRRRKEVERNPIATYSQLIPKTQRKVPAGAPAAVVPPVVKPHLQRSHLTSAEKSATQRQHGSTPHTPSKLGAAATTPHSATPAI
jgi:hypothetical protein